MAAKQIIQRRLTLTQRVAGMLRNTRPEWIGTGGRFESEWVAGLGRNMHAKQKAAIMKKLAVACGLI